MQRSHDGIEHCRIARQGVGAIKQQQRGWCTRQVGQSSFGPVRRRQRHGTRCRRHIAQAPYPVANQCEKGLGIGTPAFAQALPEKAAVVHRRGAAHQQLRVFGGIARKQCQPLAALPGQLSDPLHHIGPISRAAQVIDDDNTGFFQHIIHIPIHGCRLPQPHQVGQPNRWKIGRQSGCRFCQRRQHGVGRTQHDDVARRLLDTHNALAAIFNITAGLGGKQMHTKVLTKTWAFSGACLSA